MRMIGRAALVFVALASWPTMGQQGVNIAYVWKSGNVTVIHVNGDCVDGFITEQLCGNVDADGIAADVQEVYNAVGETVSAGDTVKVSVYEKGHRRAPDAAGSYNHNIGDGIQLRHDWMNSTGVVHHEAGHAFFNKRVGSRSCDGASCNESLVEHWGVDEGIAKVIEEAVGGGYAGSPGEDTVEEIMDGCNIQATDGGQDCAHELGRLVASAFRELAAVRSDALSIYVEAVKGLGSAATLSSLHREVAQELIDRADFHIEDPPSLSEAFDDSFDLGDLLDFLEWFERQRLDTESRGPHYSPR